jgi:PTS system fructose-specific IIA component
MNVGQLLREDTILLNMKAKDKWDAIKKMVNSLAQKGQLKADQAKVVLEALVARENVASTGMEHGVALPHATVNHIETPLAALGILPDGVNFQSQDNKPAHLIMLLVIPKKSLQIHIRTLAGVARMLNFEEMRQALLAARSAQEALRIIRDEEQKALHSRS